MARRSKQSANKFQQLLDRSGDAIVKTGGLLKEVEKHTIRAEAARDGAETALHQNVKISVSFKFVMWNRFKSRQALIMFIILYLGCHEEKLRKYSGSSR